MNLELDEGAKRTLKTLRSWGSPTSKRAAQKLLHGEPITAHEAGCLVDVLNKMNSPMAGKENSNDRINA